MYIVPFVNCDLKINVYLFFLFFIFWTLVWGLAACQYIVNQHFGSELSLLYEHPITDCHSLKLIKRVKIILRIRACKTQS